VREPLCSLFVLPILLPMARDFITLSDMPQVVLGVTGDLCQRREQFEVEALKAQHGGDVKMPELLSRLVADCPTQQQKAFSVYDRCRAVYDRASLYARLGWIATSLPWGCGLGLGVCLTMAIHNNPLRTCRLRVNIYRLWKACHLDARVAPPARAYCRQVAMVLGRKPA
jgi:hypothetical protein